MTVNITSVIDASESIRFYELYKDMFGEVTTATIKTIPELNQYILTLLNRCGESLEFDYTLTSGYYGEDRRCTLKILQLAGFNVDLHFIANNKEFVLTK